MKYYGGIEAGGTKFVCAIEEKLKKFCAGYYELPQSNYIVAPKLEGRAGVLGAVALAQRF